MTNEEILGKLKERFPEAVVDVPELIDFTVAGFTLLITLLTGVLFGLAQAIQMRSINLSDNLREGGTRTSSSRGATRFRGALVVAEVALALILLAGAGLMIRSFGRLQGVEKGFEAENVLTMRVALRGPGYEDPSTMSRTYRDLEEEITALPAVVSAGFIYDVPLSGDRPGTGLSGVPSNSGTSRAYSSVWQSVPVRVFQSAATDTRHSRTGTPGGIGRSKDNSSPVPALGSPMRNHSLSIRVEVPCNW